MMSTPHRGLPPPHGLSLPNPAEPRPNPPPLSQPSSSLTSQSLGQPLGQLPEPPRQWQGADESMRNWLHAKAEEDKRKQEEEKTRQEGLRLEQRRIEQSMLRESLQGGIPPAMVPMVFAGMSGGQLSNTAVEWAQHHMSQMSIQQGHQQQQPQPPQPQQQQPQPPPPPPPQQLQIQSQPHQGVPPHQSSPDVRRDGRTMAGPNSNPYATQAPPGLPPAPSTIQQAPAPSTAFSSPYQAATPDASRYRFQPQDPGNIQRQQSSLSRLNTGGSLAELQIQQPPPGGMQMPMGPTSHPQPQAPPQPHQTPTQSQQQPPQSSGPNIFFHHWTPPNTNKDPSTPGTKSQHTSPYASHPQSHLRHEYQSSPKKRKTGSAGGSSDKGDDPRNGNTTSPGGERDSPRFEIVRPDISAQGGRKRGMSNATQAGIQSHDRRASNTDLRSEHSMASGRASVGPERKRTLSGTPKAEVEVQ